ncbi:MAG: D-alanyl-D-alanine carboxypeptidase/D-alanyl-D-alanine-endopeptidase [Verrucomicrobia bacterium]|nr:D-alanyl-D-alanine carboxypeptidase/D-alanyl-D-alanine-endopeptidase [Verrucomicrobiota bacterium]
MKNRSVENISRRSVFFTFACWFAFQVFSAEPPPAQPDETLASLQQRISNHISQARFAAASWGVKVVSLDSGKTIFEHNAEKYFSPASNTKLYTVALALDRLRGDYRIKTSLYAVSKPNRRGTLRDDLIIYGRGDPTINARLNGGDIFRALDPLVAALTNAGVKRIKGDLIGDESYFHGPPFGSGWVWDDAQFFSGAELSALTINDNVLQLSVKPGQRVGAPCQLALTPASLFVILSNRTQTIAQGLKRNITLYRPPGRNLTYVSGQMPIDDADYTEHVTVHNPAGLFVAFFKEALTRHGIKVSGRPRAMNWLDRQAAPVDVSNWVELGSVQSPPLRDIVREIQKPSQNLYADLLLAHVGVHSPITNATPDQTSEGAGIAALGAFLAEAGIRQGDVQFEEGSGLSRNNLTTPNATVALLQFMSRHKWADAYRDALPIAGIDGTLLNRMKGTPATGNVGAKTGTLRWANSLSGFVTTAAGERLIFSIMLNRYQNPDSTHSARDEIDAIAIILAGFTGHSGKQNE